MAQSLSSNFVIYDAEFNGGFSETLQQNTDAFNEASLGALRLVPLRLRGHYDKTSMFDVISGIVSRRDTTSTGSATDTALTQDEIVGVKLNRKVGPVGVSLDALKKHGASEDGQREMSFVLGQQIAKAIQVDYLNSVLRGLAAALLNQATNTFDATDGTINTSDLISGLAKLGDVAMASKLWVMHSKAYFDLLGNQVTAAIYQADGVSIMQGVPATLGKPVLVTDSASLVTANGVSSGVDQYATLLLFEGAGEVLESESPTMVTQLVTGVENMFWRVQGEHAYNLRLRGFKWDVTNGQANPTDAAVATGSNWDMAVTSYKLLPGAVVKSR